LAVGEAGRGQTGFEMRLTEIYGGWSMRIAGTKIARGARRVSLSAIAATLLLAGGLGQVKAGELDPGDEKVTPNAVTGTTTGWKAQVTPNEAEGGAGAIPDDQKEILAKINEYMAKFTDLEGRFIQTNSDGTVQKGKFYVLRPGRMRFDYAKPSRLRIVSDGKYLSIEDHDIKTVNKYPLESTPFRMLLRKNIKLERDTRILSLSSSDNSATVTIADKSGQSAGHIQLFFSMPEVELKEWVITDAQGLNTRIEIANLEYRKKLASSLFEPTKGLGLPKAFGNN
jgi:outer membrane lipoprotein-sorting protein